MTKFLIDEDVNQKAVKAVPTAQKGFDVLYPEAGGFKGAADPAVRNRAVQEGRVLVTCDRDFATLVVPVAQMRYGVLWIRPPRISQQRVAELLHRFCRFLQSTFPRDPYNFSHKLIEIHEAGLKITTAQGDVTNYEY